MVPPTRKLLAEWVPVGHWNHERPLGRISDEVTESCIVSRRSVRYSARLLAELHPIEKSQDYVLCVFHQMWRDVEAGVSD
jgi:hypothetical protein